MDKRDRYVDVLLHRSSDTLVLAPGVCYMVGRGIGYGDPIMLTLSEQTPQQLGKHLVRLLNECKSADINAMAAHRKAGLQKYWQGEKVTPEDMHPTDVTPSRVTARDAIDQRFPVMLKGPAAILRAFAWAQLVERDAWKSRKLTRQIKSEYRGCTTGGETIRLSKRDTATALGAAVLDFVRDDL